MMDIDEPLASWIILAARLCLAGVFLVSAIHKAAWYRTSLQEFGNARLRPEGLFVALTVTLHLFGSLALIGGVYVAEATFALAAFTVLATIRVHCFWRMEGRMRLERSRVAMGNLAIVGGLILLAVVGPGRFTVLDHM
jgi:putative oxidoreductase